jgi:tetratricopeptide (TPR) repeat protein
MSKRKSKKGSTCKRKKGAPKNAQYSTSPPFPATQFDVQTALDQASRLFSLGRLDEAESLCKKILGIEPENIPTLCGIGKIAQQTGRLLEAEQYFSKLIRLLPESPEVYNDLGLILQDLGRLDEAAKKFLKATELNPVYAAAHINLGNFYFSQKKLALAVACYQRAININPHDSNAHFNLANTYNEIKLFDEAIASFQKALSLKPDHVGAMYNLGLLLTKLGRLDEAVQSLQTSVKNTPGSSQLLGALINLLNHYMPNFETDSPYVKAQKSLRQITMEYSSTPMIADENVRQLYQKCLRILILHKLDLNTGESQLFRGRVSTHKNCPRHKIIFNKFNIIPEYCFGCYKVSLEPRTVMELFKLFLVFDKLKLPNNNERKCIVESRPEMSGTYKGFIYCDSLDEAKKILNIVQPIVDESISKGIPIFVKRGCSEFQAAYPSYGLITGNKFQQMTYNEEWRKHEAYVDKKLAKPANDNPNGFTFDHSGFTLLDILVMGKWLAYAAKIGDLSYLKIVEQTLPKSSSHS